mgnify:FL=1
MGATAAARAGGEETAGGEKDEGDREFFFVGQRQVRRRDRRQRPMPMPPFLSPRVALRLPPPIAMLFRTRAPLKRHSTALTNRKGKETRGKGPARRWSSSWRCFFTRKINSPFFLPRAQRSSARYFSDILRLMQAYDVFHRPSQQRGKKARRRRRQERNAFRTMRGERAHVALAVAIVILLPKSAASSPRSSPFFSFAPI